MSKCTRGRAAPGSPGAARGYGWLQCVALPPGAPGKPTAGRSRSEGNSGERGLVPGSTPLASPRAALRDSWEGSSCSLEGAELPFTGPLAWAGALQGWARPWPAEQKPGAFQRTGQSVPACQGLRQRGQGAGRGATVPVWAPTERSSWSQFRVWGNGPFLLYRPTRSLAPRAADALKACGMERAPA